jgi:2-keto-4-pentenoate hydratase
MDRIEAAAEYLFQLRKKPRIVERIPAEFTPATAAEGYAAQNGLVRKLLEARGGTRVGYKIACTSLMAQQALAVDGPFFGQLLSHSCHGNGVTLPASAFTLRCIETEFGFEIAEDVPMGEFTAETIREFIAEVIPSIEIVDHRFTDWKTVGVHSLMADNAIHGAWVTGEPCRDWQRFDYASHPVMLFVNGKPDFPGSSSAVLGNPLNVVAWLAKTLPQYGHALKKGDRITTGVTTGIYMAEAGDRFVGDFGGIGKVEMAFV